MPSTKETNKPGHVTSGDVLDELGFSAQEIREIEIQHSIWGPIRAEVEARKLTQTQVAKILQIHQPDASLLLRGQIARFSITRLMQFADRLGLAVSVALAPKTEAQRRASSPRVPPRKATSRKSTAKVGARPRSARKAAQA